MMEIYRSKDPDAKQKCKDFYLQHFETKYDYDKKALSRVQRLSFNVWNSKNSNRVFSYIKFLVFYKYKMKLFKESKKRI